MPKVTKAVRRAAESHGQAHVRAIEAQQHGKDGKFVSGGGGGVKGGGDTAKSPLAGKGKMFSGKGRIDVPAGTAPSLHGKKPSQDTLDWIYGKRKSPLAPNVKKMFVKH